MNKGKETILRRAGETRLWLLWKLTMNVRQLGQKSVAQGHHATALTSLQGRLSQQRVRALWNKIIRVWY